MHHTLTMSKQSQLLLPPIHGVGSALCVKLREQPCSSRQRMQDMSPAQSCQSTVVSPLNDKGSKVGNCIRANAGNQVMRPNTQSEEITCSDKTVLQAEKLRFLGLFPSTVSTKLTATEGCRTTSRQEWPMNRIALRIYEPNIPDRRKTIL